MKNFEELEKKLGLNFKNKDLLTQAFTHRSYLNENPDFKLEHNERLEFLGDAAVMITVLAIVLIFIRYLLPFQPI